MSCGHSPRYAYSGWWCPYGKEKDCPRGYSYVETHTSTSPSAVDYCFGDAIKRVNRKQKKCVKTSGWSSRSKLDCCLGNRKGGNICDPNWCPNNQTCDAEILKYCSNPVNFDNPICGCSLPTSEYQQSKLFGPPECVDKRCATNPAAHRLSFQKNPTCNITNCVIGDVDIAAGNSNVDIGFIKQQCGGDYTDLTNGKNNNNNNIGTDNPGIITQKYGGNSLVWTIGGIAVISFLGLIATRPTKE